MYLLDTNIVSEIRKGGRCDRGVGHWYARVGDRDLFLSVLVTGEIRRGIQALRSRDPSRSEALEKWFAALKLAFSGRILGVTAEIAETWGALNATRTYPLFDGLMAATALAHDLVLVTRNVADVSGTTVRYLDPFRDQRVRVAR